MQNQFDPRTRTTGYDPAVSVGVPRAARDAGLRSYMPVKSQSGEYSSAGWWYILSR